MNVSLSSDSSSVQTLGTVQEIVDWCVCKGLSAPVLFFLEAHRPLRGVTAFGAQFLAPLLPGGFGKFARVLDDPNAVDLLTAKLRRLSGN